MTFQVLLIVHVLLTTTGYVGLIATDVAVLLLAGRTTDAAMARATLSTWRNATRIFGPMLGLGVLLGFGVAAAMHASLASGWLLTTYALIVIALGLQIAVEIPWARSANAALDRGELPSFGAVRTGAIALAAIYTAIVVMMVARPF